MRGRNRSSDCDASIEVPALASLDAESRQDPRRKSPRVDADAVRPLHDFSADGVPVDHDEAVRRVIQKEGFADPPEVGLPLFVKAHARPNSGMDEEIIAKAARIDEAH